MRRPTYLVGRLGSNLFVIGLALFLVYLIPSANFNGTNSAGGSIAPKTYQTPMFNTLSPTSGIHIQIQGNGSFQFLLLSAGPGEIYNWTNNWACMNGGQRFGPPGSPCTGSNNFTAIQAYLAQFPSEAIKNVTVPPKMNLSIDLTPATDINATFIVANPTSAFVTFTFSWSFSQSIAPKGSTLFFAELFMPLGLILSAPWVIQGFAARRNRNQLRTD